MASTFTFYRPRGVPRNYVVEITVEQEPGNKVEVSVNHNRHENCGHCGHQHPVEVQGTGTEHKEIYVIGDGGHPIPMIPGDTITIEVSVQNVVPKQHLVYTATDTGFTCTPQPFKLNNKQVWQPHEIAFQKIAIIDRDKKQFVPAATPPQREQLKRIQLYREMYPYLEKSVIENLVRGFTMPNGTGDWARLEGILARDNAEAKAEGKPYAAPTPVPAQEVVIQEETLPAPQSMETWEWNEPNGFTMHDLLVSPDEWYTAPKSIPNSQPIASPVNTLVASLN